MEEKASARPALDGEALPWPGRASDPGPVGGEGGEGGLWPRYGTVYGKLGMALRPRKVPVPGRAGREARGRWRQTPAWLPCVAVAVSPTSFPREKKRGRREAFVRDVGSLTRLEPVEWNTC